MPLRPLAALIIGWTLLILPPGDFRDLLWVSIPNTLWHPHKVLPLVPLVQSQLYYYYTIRVFSSMGSSFGQTQGKHRMAALAGVEPTTTESKSGVLPLHYRAIYGRRDRT